MDATVIFVHGSRMVNLDITDDVKAKAEATQQQSKVGVYFEKEY